MHTEYVDTPIVPTLAFRFPDGVRTYQRVEGVTPMLIDLIPDLEPILARGPAGETEGESARRVMFALYRDRAMFNRCMRAALYGDHDGVDWGYCYEPIRAAEALVEYFTAALPAAIAMSAEIAGADLALNAPAP